MYNAPSFGGPQLLAGPGAGAATASVTVEEDGVIFFELLAAAPPLEPQILPLPQPGSRLTIYTATPAPGWPVNGEYDIIDRLESGSGHKYQLFCLNPVMYGCNQDADFACTPLPYGSTDMENCNGDCE